MDRTEKLAPQTIYLQMTNTGYARGFTILELVIVIGILGLFAATATTFLISSKDDEVLRFESALKNFIRDTKYLATSSKSTNYIHFNNTKVWRSTDPSPNFESSSPNLLFPKGVEFFVKKEEFWQKMQKNTTATWLFSRSGICEPCSVRFTSGKSSFLLEFHQLTGGPNSSL